LAVVMVFFGVLVLGAGRQTLGHWASIGAAYAACGVIWSLAGPAMVLAGLWSLGSLGRHRIPVWIGSAAAVVAGAVLVAGVLTYVIPCSGPS
jgi:hypothetical protein